MDILLKFVKIISPSSPFHLQTKDVLVSKGKISKIDDNISADCKIISVDGLVVSEGWLDLFSVIREPGNEHKDTIEKLLSSAAKGGFTQVLGISGTTPPMDNKAQVQYAKTNSAGNVVTLLPAGTITEGQKGEEITEMYDMHLSGAVAFCDGKKTLSNPELLKRALLYTKPFDGKIITYCEDEMVANNGMISEGKVAATLGLKVRPALAEEIAINRDLFIAEYTDCAIHITGVSSKRSVAIIKEAKSKGIKVTCDVNIANLYFTDEAVTSFEPNFKVLPPLRSEEDRKGLIAGLKTGAIDAVTSGHTPQDIESKFCEFDNAEFGAVTLEATFKALYTILKDSLSISEIVALISSKPSDVLNIDNTIQIGSKANLTLFTLQEATEFKLADVKSFSKNSPFIGTALEGNIVGVINNNELHLN
jgi:dihydroorotase